MKIQGPKDFSWQNGYGAFTLGRSDLDALRHYIDKQEEHHHKTSFQDELRTLLERYQVNYDEKYLWD